MSGKLFLHTCGEYIFLRLKDSNGKRQDFFITEETQFLGDELSPQKNYKIMFALREIDGEQRPVALQIIPQ